MRRPDRFNPNDPVEDTESGGVGDGADLVADVSTPTIRSRILKEQMQTAEIYRSRGFNPNDPFEDTERGREVYRALATAQRFQPQRSVRGY